MTLDPYGWEDKDLGIHASSPTLAATRGAAFRLPSISCVCVICNRANKQLYTKAHLLLSRPTSERCCETARCFSLSRFLHLEDLVLIRIFALISCSRRVFEVFFCLSTEISDLSQNQAKQGVKLFIRSEGVIPLTVPRSRGCFRPPIA